MKQNLCILKDLRKHVSIYGKLYLKMRFIFLRLNLFNFLGANGSGRPAHQHLDYLITKEGK